MSTLWLLGLITALVAKGTVVPIPWLSTANAFTIGSVVAIVFVVALLAFFRNEISRLESFTPARWILLDSAIVGLAWALLWGLALDQLIDYQVPYAFGIAAAIGIVAGQWLPTDTLVLVLVGLLVLQTALWSMLGDTPLQYLCFFLCIPRIGFMVPLSALGMMAVISALPDYKRRD
ncbi:MAG: hypothetical protein Q3976_04235 [Corynebacterium sp.]|nr:hypothetical protein [Corynebacterium sp.]